MPDTTFARPIATLLIAATLAGCSALQAQNPSSALKPVNAVAMDGDERVMLQGHDVVAYFTKGEPVEGVAAYAVTWRGATWYFSSPESLMAFEMNPEAWRDGKRPERNGSGHEGSHK